MNKYNFIDNFIRYFYLFIFFCIIGWIYEVTLGFIYGYGFVERGFLYGPYLPVYGFGAVVLIISLTKIIENPKYIGKIPVTPIIIFFLVVLITTTIELVTSYIMEYLFNARWWDYSINGTNHPYHFQGRISTRASFRFGLGGLLFLYICTPFFDKMLNKMSRKSKIIILFIILVIILADLYFTVTN